jgi:hypothetical protein
MDYKYIEQLLDRYFEAMTTLKEEQILKNFFSQDDEEIPSGLRQYKSLFAALDTDDQLGDDFDERILRLTEESVAGRSSESDVQTGSRQVKARTITLAERLRPLFRAAAVVAILVTLSTALNQSFNQDNVWNGEEQFAEYKAAIQGAQMAAAADSIKLLTEGLAGRTDSLVVDSLYKPTGYIE